MMNLITQNKTIDKLIVKVTLKDSVRKEILELLKNNPDDMSIRTDILKFLKETLTHENEYGSYAKYKK